MIYFLKKKDQFLIEINFINLTFLCYLFRTAIPWFKYPFLIIYVGLLVYSAINYRKQLISSLIDFFRIYYLLLILVFILFIAFLFSNKLYLMIFKDGVNIFILLSIFFILNLIVSSKKEFDFFVSNLIYLIILFAFLISIFGLLDLFDILSQSSLFFKSNVFKDYLLIDNNFALLPVFFGMIGVLYFLPKINSKPKKIYYNFLLIIFSLNIILSGSRRGLIILIGVVVVLLLSQINLIFKRDNSLKKLGIASIYYLVSVLILSSICYFFVFHTPYSFKNRIIESLGSRNILMTKTKIALNMFKYLSIFDKKTSYSDLFKIIWTPSFNPNDPESSWGTRIHKTIFPLTGKNVEIVPPDAKGYLIDSTCFISPFPKYDNYDSYSLLANLKVSRNEKYQASVFCYVSEDFDGSCARLLVGWIAIEGKAISNYTIALYDLKNKGIWQKLEIEFDCNDGEVPIYMSFIKDDGKNFSELKGYIIFAYPQYKKIIKSENGLSFKITQSKGNFTELGKIDLAKKTVDQKCNKSLNHHECINDINKSYIITHDTVIRHYLTPSTTFTSNTQKYFSSGIFCFPLSILLESGSIQNDSDPIRNWASKFISEDTTYYPYKANIVVDTISNSFSGPRIARWQFAIKIFTKEYSWSQKIFGDGFNFLNWYGYYFDKDKTRSDYPHNPFLSILLYSGILGLIVYLIFMYRVSFYYVKYIKEYKILAVFFIITFFFSFFSAGSPFDPPIMGFFVILPFFIHSIHKKKEPVLDDDHINQEIGSIS